MSSFFGNSKDNDIPKRSFLGWRIRQLMGGKEFKGAKMGNTHRPWANSLQVTLLVFMSHLLCCWIGLLESDSQLLLLHEDVPQVLVHLQIEWQACDPYICLLPEWWACADGRETGTWGQIIGDTFTTILPFPCSNLIWSPQITPDSRSVSSNHFKDLQGFE